MTIRDLDEAIDLVGRVYCPHRIEPSAPDRRVNTVFRVAGATEQAVVHLRYSAPVVVNAGRFPNLLLLMSASSGAARAEQNGNSISWRAGQTVPLSPGRETIFRFDHAFAQNSLRVNVEQLERTCASLLGYPLEKPIAFELCPLPNAFEAVWQDALRVLCTITSSGIALTPTAAESLDNFLLSTILHGHRHNFSEQLERPVPAATPRVVASAKQLFSERAESGTTVAAVARELGVSIRTLQNGFQKVDQTTPSAFLRRARLDAAHRILTSATEDTSVTDVALRLGFAHVGRFSADYRLAFGEPPAATLRRYRPR
ncbi:helix-turn-helix domain-containing protein [Paraburkholderia phymatum]|uniref:AraC-like ligand-binding domain-containing protein n=1 Tax=Paraburkholderia TaxID=1822464 RepID=UPI00316EEF2A